MLSLEMQILFLTILVVLLCCFCTGMCLAYLRQFAPCLFRMEFLDDYKKNSE